MGSAGDQDRKPRGSSPAGVRAGREMLAYEVGVLSEDKGWALLRGVVVRRKHNSLFPTHQPGAGVGLAHSGHRLLSLAGGVPSPP